MAVLTKMVAEEGRATEGRINRIDLVYLIGFVSGMVLLTSKMGRMICDSKDTTALRSAA